MELNFDSVKYEWPVYRSSEYGIQVVAWKPEYDPHSGWIWNVYVMFPEDHPYFQDPDRAISDIPFHWGCTFAEKIQYAPARGIEYDWQEAQNILKVGCDYNHLYDYDMKLCDPKDGIPYRIRSDVEVILNHLKGDKNDEAI